MSQIRSFTRSSRDGRPYAAGFKANSRGPGGLIESRLLKVFGAGECEAICPPVRVALADQAPRIGAHQFSSCSRLERRLEQLHQGTLAREEGSMRAEQQPVHGDRTPIAGFVPSISRPTPPFPSVAAMSNVTCVSRTRAGTLFPSSGPAELINCTFADGTFFNTSTSGDTFTGGTIDRRMMHALVFQTQDDLDQHAPLRRLGEQPRELGVIERVAVIGRIEPHAAHAVSLVAAPQVFFPVRPGRVDAADGDQHAVSVRSGTPRPVGG